MKAEKGATTAIWVLGLLVLSCESPTIDKKSATMDWYPDRTLVHRIHQESEGVESLTIVAENPMDEVYRVSVLTTKDRGKSWQPVPGKRNRFYTWEEVSHQRVAPSDEDVRYFSIQHLNLYLRSTNAGASWVLPRYEVGGVAREEMARRIGGTESHRLQMELAAISPTDPLHIFGTFTVDAWRPPGSHVKSKWHKLPGMYQSYDGGETWQLVTELIRPDTPLGISPTNPNVMIGVSDKGLVKSADGGESWTQLGAEADSDSAHPLLTGMTKEPVVRLLEILVIKFHPRNQNLIYVVADSGLYRSEDGGNSWRDLQTPLPENMFNSQMNPINSIGLFEIDDDDVVIGTSLGVFLSADKGDTWNRIYPQ